MSLQERLILVSRITDQLPSNPDSLALAEAIIRETNGIHTLRAKAAALLSARKPHTLSQALENEADDQLNELLGELFTASVGPGTLSELTGADDLSERLVSVVGERVNNPKYEMVMQHHHDGMTAVDMVRTHSGKLSRTLIYKYLAHAGFKANSKNTHVTEDQRASIIRLYKTGNHLQDIATRVGVSLDAVNNTVRRARRMGEEIERARPKQQPHDGNPELKRVFK